MKYINISNGIQIKRQKIFWNYNLTNKSEGAKKCPSIR